MKSTEDYIYVLEDAAGNIEQVKPEEAMKRLENGNSWKIKIYRLWRTYEEKKP